jgi:putative mycofactocin binding protein MftB
VALRPEPFGAVAYHYDNRKLNFVRSPLLVELLRDLGSHPSPRRAFDHLTADGAEWERFARALDTLAASDFLQPAPMGHERSAANPGVAP